jgi:hypothetical protein
VQALKLHFIAELDAAGPGGARAAKRGRPDAPAPAPQQPQADAAPQQPQQQQPGADYAAFTAALLRTLGGPAPPGLQVAALVALMECARHEEGPGACSGRAVEAVVNSAVRGASVAPEAFALLFSRYLPHLDVRYHALKAAGRLAARMAAGAAAKRAGAKAAREEGAQQQQNGGGGGGGECGAAAGITPTADGVRSLFDVLAHVAPLRPGDDLSAATSWCGATEVRPRGWAWGAVGAGWQLGAGAKGPCVVGPRAQSVQCGGRLTPAPSALATFAQPEGGPGGGGRRRGSVLKGAPKAQGRAGGGGGRGRRRRRGRRGRRGRGGDCSVGQPQGAAAGVRRGMAGLPAA